MGLEFKPPEWLLQEYMNRKTPGEEALSGAQQAASTYMAYKQQQSKQESDALGNYLKLVDLDPELAKTPLGQKLSKMSGGGLGGWQPPSSSTAPATSNQFPTMTPTTPDQIMGDPATIHPSAMYSTPGEQSAGMSMDAEHSMEPNFTPQNQSPILAHWHQTMGGQQQPPAAAPMAQAPMPPAPAPQPLGPTPVPQLIAGRGKLGDKINAQTKAGLEMRKLTEGFDANEPASFDEVKTTFSAANRPEIADALIKNAQAQGMPNVQRKSVDAAIKGLGVASTGIRGGAMDSMAHTREVQLRDSLIKEARATLDPYFQSGAGKQWALKLNRIAGAEPLFEQMRKQNRAGDHRQMVETATSVANIITGSNIVAQAQIEHLVPDTYKGRLGEFMEKLKNEPWGLDQQAFLDRLEETVAREKFATQGQARANAERGSKTLLVLKSEHPDDYKQIIDTYLNQSPDLMGPAGGGAEGLQTISDNAAFAALPSGAKFKDPEGVVHTKR